MSRRIPIPGSTATDRAVLAWLAKKGISKNDVTGYEINRQVGEIPVIKISMIFDEEIIGTGPWHPTCVDAGDALGVEFICSKDCPP